MNPFEKDTRAGILYEVLHPMFQVMVDSMDRGEIIELAKIRIDSMSEDTIKALVMLLMDYVVQGHISPSPVKVDPAMGFLIALRTACALRDHLDSESKTKGN